MSHVTNTDFCNKYLHLFWQYCISSCLVIVKTYCYTVLYYLYCYYFLNPNELNHLARGWFSLVLQEGNITWLWAVRWGTGSSRRGWSCCWMITRVRAASVWSLITAFRVRTRASYGWCWTTVPWPSGRSETLWSAAGSQSRSPSAGRRTLQRPWVTV